MTRKKNFLKNLCVLGVAVVIWTILAFFRASGIADYLNGLSTIVFVVGVTLIVEGVARRLFFLKKGYRVSWKYLVFEGLLFIDCILWVWFSACHNWKEFILRLCVLAIGLAVSGVWGFLFAFKGEEDGETSTEVSEEKSEETDENNEGKNEG